MHESVGLALKNLYLASGLENVMPCLRVLVYVDYIRWKVVPNQNILLPKKMLIDSKINIYLFLETRVLKSRINRAL